MSAMYSELRIVTSNDLSKRSYVCFYLNGKRIRESNGKNLGLDIRPNLAHSLKEREKLLKKLEYELRKALDNDNYPVKQLETVSTKEIKVANDAQTLLQQALDSKLNSNLATYYKRNLTYVHADFIAFLTPEELDASITDIKPIRIEQFLQRYKSSGTYYMNKRRELGVLFSTVGHQLETQLLTVRRTTRMKSKAKLHKIYNDVQLHAVLDYLKIHHENLYLCCLLSYGTFLRPHREVRNLCVRHLKKDCTEIHLSGDENKSGRVRIVSIPGYVREILITRIADLQPSNNIFTGSDSPFNEAYFMTSWTRQWVKMNKLGIIEENQTIYSFRHTAAVYVYRKTKDIHVVQQLMGHSDMIVTLNYLRGLGELNLEDQKQYMPEL